MSSMSRLQRSISDIFRSSTEIQPTHYRQHRISNTRRHSARDNTVSLLSIVVVHTEHGGALEGGQWRVLSKKLTG